MSIQLFKNTLSSCLVIVLLGACSVNYQARLPNGAGGGVGYQEQRLTDGTILLYYYGNSYATDVLIKKYWQQRADELCPQGYTEIEFLTFKEYGTLRSPVMGRMTTLGTIKIHGKGKIDCQLKSSRQPQNQ